MARTGRPKAALQLSHEERATLQRWAHDRKAAQPLALRCRIVLACADGVSNTQVAADLGVSDATVGKWRRRFVESRLAGLVDEPRPGQPRKITDEVAQEVLLRTFDTPPPDGAAAWSTRQMAAATGLSQTAVSRIWRTFGLSPRRRDVWRLSRDPLLACKVRDIVGLYLDPPERAVALSVDARSRLHAADPAASRAPQDSAQIDIARMVAAIALATGKAVGTLQARDRAAEFKRFLQSLDRALPDHFAVHLILDRHVTHRTPQVKRWLLAHPRFVVHLTPSGTSWVSLVVQWFTELAQGDPARGGRSARELDVDIRAWLRHWNERPGPYSWTRAADESRDGVTLYIARINASSGGLTSERKTPLAYEGGMWLGELSVVSGGRDQERPTHMSKAESDAYQTVLRRDFDTIDISRNGVIESGDIDGWVDRIAGAFGAAPGSEEHAAFAATNQPWRDAMYAALAKDSDHRIDFAEYLTFWSGLSDEDAIELVQPWMDGLFALADDNDDQKLTRAEFLAYCSALGLDGMDGAFDALDTNGNGYLSREEFGRYMSEAVTSTDADAPGRALYVGTAA